MKYSLFAVFIFGFLAVFLTCLLGVASPALAQFNVVPQDDINVTMTPANPGPNQQVSVSIVSYSTDVNAATVTWKINGKTIQSGRGLKNFSFTTGNTNVTTTLNIIVNTSDGETIDKSIVVQPSSVDLLWQTDSYIPPFYKGKPLYSYQNKITFIAVPHLMGAFGTEIGAKNLIYTWTINGSVDAANSGAGVNTYSLVGSIIARPLDVQVEVTSPSSAGVGDAEVVVAPIDPQVVLYENNPLYGIQFQNALQNNVTLSGSQEITVAGVPFFFGALSDTAPELTYTWKINGSQIQDDGRETSQVFRQTSGTSGASNISLSVGDTAKILQTASNNFNLEFGTNANTQTTSF